MTKIKCDRCNGSGEIGVSTRLGVMGEKPGPVPDDARGYFSRDCPDCGGEGYSIQETQPEGERWQED
jgi:DnaJ-class molecular chaperone